MKREITYFVFVVLLVSTVIALEPRIANWSRDIVLDREDVVTVREKYNITIRTFELERISHTRAEFYTVATSVPEFFTWRVSVKNINQSHEQVKIEIGDEVVKIFHDEAEKIRNVNKWRIDHKEEISAGIEPGDLRVR